MAGVNWKVSLMPIKVCDSFGFCDEGDILQGIDFAVGMWPPREAPSDS